MRKGAKGAKMADEPTKDIKLAEIDLDAEGAPFESVIADIKKLNKLEIVDFQEGDFRADVTGQKGTIEFIVRGVSRNYSLGADTVIQVSMNTGQKVQIVEAKLKSFMRSEHFTKLRSAKKRQLKRLAKKS